MTSFYKKQKYMTKKTVFGEYERAINYFIIGCWLIVFVDFCVWWFTKSTITSIPGFILISLSVFWLPLLFLYFFYFALRQKDFSVYVAIPKGRIAMLTTKVPSESNELLQRTLLAMKNQYFTREYDVWLLDEDPNDTLTKWCKANGVIIQTRKYHPHYHRAEYPAKARTKEGNVRYFLDHFGYKKYDFLIQFDADHAPEPQFLNEVMKEFNDPEVGYVASPSIVDGNLKDSWTVSARNHWEASNHGPIQSGSNDGYAPMCFGSHYSHRMKALREIGGIGPESAEDHTTTLLYNAHGWRGGFARNAIAHGYGAVGMVDSMLQEFQWAMVGMRAALLITPQYFSQLSGKVKAQFILWELWYPLVTVITLISIFMPIYALYSGNPIVKVESEGFIYRYAWLMILFFVFSFWLRNQKHFRPHWSLPITLQTMAFQHLQFPWIAIGWVYGLLQVVFHLKPGKIAITDKDSIIKKMPFQFFIPHIVIIIIALVPFIIIPSQSEAHGYLFFAGLIAISYAFSVALGISLTFLDMYRHLKFKKVWWYIIDHWHSALLMMICSTIVFQVISSLSH